MYRSWISRRCIALFACAMPGFALQPAWAGEKTGGISRGVVRPTYHARISGNIQTGAAPNLLPSDRALQVLDSVAPGFSSGAQRDQLAGLLGALAEGGATPTGEAGIACDIVGPDGAPTRTVELGSLGSPSYGFRYLSGGTAAAAVAFVAYPVPPGGSLQLLEHIHLNTSGSSGDVISPFVISGEDNCGLWVLLVINTFGDLNACLFEVACPADPCVEGSSEEEEDCGLPADTFNGGCNSTPPVFAPLFCGQTYCGTAGSEGTFRDTDWYEIFIESPTLLTWTVQSDFPALIGLIETSDPGSATCSDTTGFVDPFELVPAGSAGSVSACLQPGTYWWFVAPDITAGPVACPAEYTATVSCSGCR